MVHLVKQCTWHVSNLHLFLLNTENSYAENWNSLYTSCQLQSILKVIIITSTRHVVHIQLEQRRQLLNEARLFVTDPGALQRCSGSALRNTGLSQHVWHCCSSPEPREGKLEHRRESTGQERGAAALQGTWVGAVMIASVWRPQLLDF